MINPKYAPEILGVIEKWVPEQGVRAALLCDLAATVVYHRNKSFRDTVDMLLREYHQKKTRAS